MDGSYDVKRDKMSGGNWDYTGAKLLEWLTFIGNDGAARRRWPMTINAFYILGDPLRKAEHEMDWDLSGDKKIDDDKQFDEAALWSLVEPLLELSPDHWFPRGKWATIQALQTRQRSLEEK